MMIYDNIENASRYTGLSKLLATGLNTIPNYLGRDPGRYEIDGDDLFLLVQHYDSVPAENKKWETHRRYIDIQYIESGCELIGFGEMSAMTVDTPYSSEGDGELYTGDGIMLPMQSGSIAIFYPGEPHMPGVAVNAPESVKKIIVKVKAE